MYPLILYQIQIWYKLDSWIQQPIVCTQELDLWILYSLGRLDSFAWVDTTLLDLGGGSVIQTGTGGRPAGQTGAPGRAGLGRPVRQMGWGQAAGGATCRSDYTGQAQRPAPGAAATWRGMSADSPAAPAPQSRSAALGTTVRVCVCAERR